MSLSNDSNESNESNTHISNYLDIILKDLDTIYKCPCVSCITNNANIIKSMINSILEFYKFIIYNKEFIKNNKKYFTEITSLISNMSKFHKEIIKDTDIQFMNIETNVIIIYIEEQEEGKTNIKNIIVNSQDATFQLRDIIKYYPELEFEN